MKQLGGKRLLNWREALYRSVMCVLGFVSEAGSGCGISYFSESSFLFGGGPVAICAICGWTEKTRASLHNSKEALRDDGTPALAGC